MTVVDVVSQEVKIVTCADLDDAFSALSTGELFISLNNEKDKLDIIVSKLYEVGNLFYDEIVSKNPAPNTTIALNTILDAMKETGGKAVIFCTDFPIGGIGALSKVGPDDGKSNQPYKILVKPYFLLKIVAY
jgi:Sec23/Sec24 trunk domain